MDAVHERRIVLHLLRKRREEMSFSELILHVDVEVPDHHDAAGRLDRLAAATELSRLHIALEDVHPLLRVELHAGHLVEADDVVLCDEAALPASEVHEHVRDAGLTSGHEVCVRGDLLEEVGLPGTSWPELDSVVVADDEGQHAEKQDVLLALGEGCGFEADAAQQERSPLLQGELRTTADVGLERVTGRHLDGPDGFDTERRSTLFTCERCDVLESHLGVEAPGQHPVVLVDELGGDVDVLELKARKLRSVGVCIGVEPRAE